MCVYAFIGRIIYGVPVRCPIKTLNFIATFNILLPLIDKGEMTMNTDHTIDTVGKFCPVPIIEAANKIKDIAVGDTLAVLSDDVGITSDMPNWCNMTGHEFLAESEEDGVYTVIIRKTAE